jgi:hypothetical protein
MPLPFRSLSIFASYSRPDAGHLEDSGTGGFIPARSGQIALAVINPLPEQWPFGCYGYVVSGLLGQSERRPELVLVAQAQLHRAVSRSEVVLMSQPARNGLGLGRYPKQDMHSRTSMDVENFTVLDSKRPLA